MSFIKVILDQKSLDFFAENFQLIKPTLSRSLIFKAVFDMTLDGLCPFKYFINLVQKIFETESDVRAP